MLLKKYKKISTIAVFLVFAHQCFSQGPIHNEFQLKDSTVESEFLPYSTDMYIYSYKQKKEQTNSHAFVKLTVLGDTIVNHYFDSGKTRTLVSQEIRDGYVVTIIETWKTKNPSYFTMTNLSFAAYATYIVAMNVYYEIQNQTMILRHKELPNHLTKYGMTGNENEFILALSRHYSDEKYMQFLNKINAHTSQDFFLTGDAIAKAYYEIENRDETWLDKQVNRLQDNYLRSSFGKIIAGPSLDTAYHEAGHALVAAQSKEYVFKYATNIGLADSGGSCYISESNLGYKIICGRELNTFKEDIKISLAGGVAMSIASNDEKLAFQDFLQKTSYGMGTVSTPGGDIYDAHQSAEQYCKSVHGYVGYWLPQSEQQHKQEVNDILEACYHEVYADLSAQKNTLIELGNELYRKKVIISAQVDRALGENIT